MTWWNPLSWFKRNVAEPVKIKKGLGVIAHAVEINPSLNLKAQRAYGRLYRVRVAINSGDTRSALKDEKKKLEAFLGGQGLPVPSNVAEAREYSKQAWE